MFLKLKTVYQIIILASVVYLKIFYSRCLHQQKEQEGQETGVEGLKIPLSAFLLKKRGKKASKPGKFQTNSLICCTPFLLEMENLQCKYSHKLQNFPNFAHLNLHEEFYYLLSS